MNNVATFSLAGATIVGSIAFGEGAIVTSGSGAQ